MKKTAIITVTVLAIIAVAVTAFAVTSANKTFAEVSVDSVSNVSEESSALEYTAELIEIETENDPADEEIIEEVVEATEPETIEEAEDITEEKTEAPAAPVIEKPVIRTAELKAPAVKAPVETKSENNEAAKTVTVRFDANGGSSAARRTFKAGETYGTLPVPSHSGHTFLGWFTTREGGEQVTAKSVVPAKDHTLYARWSASRTIEEPVCRVTVHFASEIYTGKTPEDIEVIYGSTYSDLTALDDVDSYHFAGWYTADGRHIQKTSVVETGEDHTLYARWEQV